MEEQKLGDAGYEREELYHGSMISIKDIAQVRGEVPASPATNQKQQGIKETYFQWWRMYLIYSWTRIST